MNIIPFLMRTLVFIALAFGFSLFTHSQSNSNILLVFTDLKKCDEGCKNDTKLFRNLIKSSLWDLGVFKDTISYTGYHRENMRRNFKNYCKQKQVGYYLTSKLTEVKAGNAKAKYYISFSLYDLNNEIKENPRFEFELDVDRPGASIESIKSILKEDLNYFIENNYQFKPVVKVEVFDDIDPDRHTDHIEVFPEWMVIKLNENRNTSLMYRFSYVNEEVNEHLEEYFISGRLNLIEENDSIKIIFWMNNSQNNADVIISKNYKAEDAKTRELIIKKVIGILNQSQ